MNPRIRTKNAVACGIISFGVLMLTVSVMLPHEGHFCQLKKIAFIIAYGLLFPSIVVVIVWLIERPKDRDRE